MREYGHSGKCFLKCGKSHACLVGKLECDSFAGEAGEQDNNVGVVEDKAMIKISEAEEGLNILYFLSPEGLSMDQVKVKVIQDWPEPWKVRDVQSFLGFANFYRRFIFNYSDI